MQKTKQQPRILHRYPALLSLTLITVLSTACSASLMPGHQDKVPAKSGLIAQQAITKGNAMITCRLSATPTLVATSEHLVNIVFTNQFKHPIKILSWFTPLEGMRNDIFDVTRNGDYVDYHGIMLKRGMPEEKDWFVVAPGGVVSEAVDLNLGYDVSQPGAYKVLFNRELEIMVQGEKRTIDVHCPAYEFTVEKPVQTR